ncbi:hypothetical protein R6Q59_017253, partial [Mikania micrantha]
MGIFVPSLQISSSFTRLLIDPSNADQISLAAGGVGKTTTANVGLSLARLGFSVNYSVVEVLNGDCRLNQAL